MQEVIFVEANVVAITVRVTESVQAKRDKMVAAHECLGCERKFPGTTKFRCGQCTTCYPQTRKALKARKTTVSELVRQGKMLPPGRAGRRPGNKYTQSLADM